jgi:hypothetical protein
MTEESYIYMNLNTYPVEVRTPWGVPLTLRPNTAVKGDFFSRYALPKGSLSMVHESRVAASAILFTAVPESDRAKEIWKMQAKKDDPILVEIPAPKTATVTKPVEPEVPSIPVVPVEIITVPDEELETVETDITMPGGPTPVERVSDDDLAVQPEPPKRGRKKKTS